MFIVSQLIINKIWQLSLQRWYSNISTMKWVFLFRKFRVALLRKVAISNQCEFVWPLANILLYDWIPVVRRDSRLGAYFSALYASDLNMSTICAKRLGNNVRLIVFTDYWSCLHWRMKYISAIKHQYIFLFDLCDVWWNSAQQIW